MDDDALEKALADGKVKKYVTDFTDDRVINFDHTIVLPHLGASSAEAEENCASMAVDQIMDYIENGNIVNSVNFPACSLGAKADGASRDVYKRQLERRAIDSPYSLLSLKGSVKVLETSSAKLVFSVRSAGSA